VRRSGKRAPRSSTSPAAPELPAEWQGHERELAERALRATKDLDLGALNRLGPRIQRQVQEALFDAPAEERERTATDIAEGMEILEKIGRKAPWIVAAEIVTFALIVLAIYLIIRAL
jgi:hypothetical protein